MGMSGNTVGGHLVVSTSPAALAAARIQVDGAESGQDGVAAVFIRGVGTTISHSF